MILQTRNEKLIFYKIPSLIFCLIPFFLITGPFLSDLSISLISLIFLYYCFKKKKFNFFKNKFFYLFLIFWFYLIFNSLINNFNLDSLKISIFYFRYGVFVVAISVLLNYDKSFLKPFFYCILVCFTVLIIDGFYQYFNGTNILGYKILNAKRVSSFFGDELILGSYISRLWPLFFGLFIIVINKNSFLYYIFVIIFILSEILIFLSGDRTAFFYINLSAIFIILFSKNLYKLRLITLIISILIIILLSFYYPQAKERVFDKTIDQMNLQYSFDENKEKERDKKIYLFSKQHTAHYISSYKMFLDNKILGVGIKNFRVFCKEKKYEYSKLSCSTHPHNTYVQILAETGIIGFLFLSFILIYFIKEILKHLYFKFKKTCYFSDFEICILSGIAIYLWPIIPTGSVFNNWLNIIMILNLPFLIWYKNLFKLSK